jgi:hypothetical protein
MTHTSPAAPTAPFLLRPGTGETVPGPEPATVPLAQDAGTSPGTAVPAPVPMSVPERARLAVTGWASTAAGIAGRLWLPFGRALHPLAHPEPETMAQHRAYIRSAAWVPPELAGTPATVIRLAGTAYHVMIGHPLKASMKSAVKVAQNIDQAAERPLWFFMAAVFVSALILILLHL